jgi:hypothetical protein
VICGDLIITRYRDDQGHDPVVIFVDGDVWYDAGIGDLLGEYQSVIWRWQDQTNLNPLLGDRDSDSISSIYPAGNYWMVGDQFYLICFLPFNGSFYQTVACCY